MTTPLWKPAFHGDPKVSLARSRFDPRNPAWNTRDGKYSNAVVPPTPVLGIGSVVDVGDYMGVILGEISHVCFLKFMSTSLKKIKGIASVQVDVGRDSRIYIAVDSEYLVAFLAIRNDNVCTLAMHHDTYIATPQTVNITQLQSGGDQFAGQYKKGNWEGKSPMDRAKTYTQPVDTTPTRPASNSLIWGGPIGTTRMVNRRELRIEGIVSELAIAVMVAGAAEEDIVRELCTFVGGCAHPHTANLFSKRPLAYIATYTDDGTLVYFSETFRKISTYPTEPVVAELKNEIPLSISVTGGGNRPNARTVKELRALAALRGVPGRSAMNKAQLLIALKKRK